MRSAHRQNSKYLSCCVKMSLALVALCFMGGCAQRAHLNPNFGVSYQSVFYQQSSTPAIQLAPTTAEDAKRISESRNRRSGQAASGRASRFGFASSGSGSGEFLGE